MILLCFCGPASSILKRGQFVEQSAPITKQGSYFLNCDWPAVKFLFFGTSAIFTSAIAAKAGQAKG